MTMARKVTRAKRKRPRRKDEPERTSSHVYLMYRAVCESSRNPVNANPKAEARNSGRPDVIKGMVSIECQTSREKSLIWNPAPRKRISWVQTALKLWGLPKAGMRSMVETENLRDKNSASKEREN